MDKILVIDDERVIRNTLKEALEYEGYSVDTAEGGAEGLDMVRKNKYGLVICDIKMEGMDGLEFLEKVTADDNLSFPVIMISGHGRVQTAVECVKMGAFDFIEKPLDLNVILMRVRNAMEKKEGVVKARRKNKSKQSASADGVDEIIGQSPAITNIKKLMSKVATSEARVLITGSNGTGKELVARGIHRMSHRSSGPYVEVNCAAIPGELIESEMFGHEKGAFTSADKQRKGKFELADGGTLFLDEIGDMSLPAQAKVLRALQEGKITRVGADKDIEVNVRVIAASNKNFAEEIRNGNFREDLYHRLSVVVLHVPALADRREDIPLLIDHFVKRMCDKENIPAKSFTDKAIEMLQQMPWTGNVRQLLNIVERLVVFTKDEDRPIDENDVQSYVIDMQSIM
ncbi:MAG: sigma-54 dependent transcriptional regulator [Rikenellaceae bacterium]|nr:sigma-54 dependent transcriptional regulator [Rikenellaceae bacterium]